jgi:type IV secretion system protein VirB6
VGELTLSMLKIGVVLALATNWPAYQQVVFNALFDGPEQLSGFIFGAIIPGRGFGGPFDGLQAAFDALQNAAGFLVHSGPALVSPWSGGTAFAGASLNLAAYLMLFSTLGVVLIAKVVLALLLALAPVFAALLLFENTRGMFAGWLKAAFAFAFIPLFTILALMVQLILLQPYWAPLAEMRASGQPDLGLANTVFVLLFISSLVSLAGTLAVFIIALSLKLPGRRKEASQHSRSAHETQMPGPATVLPAASPALSGINSLVTMLERRDAHSRHHGDLPQRLRLGAAPRDESDWQPAMAGPYRHPVRPRMAASGRRGDP